VNIPGITNGPLLVTVRVPVPVPFVAVAVAVRIIEPPDVMPITVPPTEPAAEHETATLVTVRTVPSTVPLPFVTVHVWPVGCVKTVTLYGAVVVVDVVVVDVVAGVLTVTGVANVKGPFADSTRLSVLLFCSVIVWPELRPLKVPPIDTSPPPHPATTRPATAQARDERGNSVMGKPPSGA
jgi:hypothetical protein